MVVQSYKDLDVWQKAVELVLSIYAATKEFPREELYGLTSQIRRAAVSVPSNIAEGRAKRSTKDFMRFLNIAYGSIAEVETQIIISHKLGYIEEEKAKFLSEEAARVGRMINGMLVGLEKKLASPRMPNAECRMLGSQDA